MPFKSMKRAQKRPKLYAAIAHGPRQMKGEKLNLYDISCNLIRYELIVDLYTCR